jgi:hypothetical protein
MSTFSSFASSRSFQVWEYQVSHGRLVIRSPRSPGTLDEPEQTTNVDLHFWGVDYFELPGILRGIEIAPPMEQDVERIGAILRKRISPVKIVVLRSGNHRFFVVADSFEITENEWDIFESPIEFRSHFRAK